jgi:hypothetical protein
LWHFHVYMYYNSNWFISSISFLSSGLKILYSFLYRKYINHVHLLNFLLLPSLSHMFIIKLFIWDLSEFIIKPLRATNFPPNTNSAVLCSKVSGKLCFHFHLILGIFLFPLMLLWPTDHLRVNCSFSMCLYIFYNFSCYWFLILFHYGLIKYRKSFQFFYILRLALGSKLWEECVFCGYWVEYSVNIC